MNAPSSEVEASTKLRYYEESIDDLEAGSRRLILDGLTHVVLFSFYFVFQVAHLLVNIEPSISAETLHKPIFLMGSAAIALIAAGYIAVSFLRQRRDVIGNEVRDLRLRISHLAALEQARSADVLTNTAGR